MKTINLNTARTCYTVRKKYLSLKSSRHSLKVFCEEYVSCSRNIIYTIIINLTFKIFKEVNIFFKCTKADDII